MKWIRFISILILTGCTQTYEHTLILDNNSLWNLEVITYSTNPGFADTVTVNRGDEIVLFHSEEKEYADLQCLANIDSAKVKVFFRDFHGNFMDPNSWTIETVNQSYKKLTFCTFEFNAENVN